MKRKRKPKKRIGTSLTGLTSRLAVLVLAVGFFLVTILPIKAAPKKKPALDTYALVSVSIFDDSGYALADANLILSPEAQSDSAPDKAKGKTKPLEAVSGERGEYVFRVPPGPSHYTLTVEAKGYHSQRKNVSIEDQERVEVTFQLERQSK